METVVGIKTDFGIIKGRDGIYLDLISNPKETELILKGEFNTSSGFHKYKIKFTNIVYQHSIELDFDERDTMASFGFINKSALLKKFRKIDHSKKWNANHRHFYFRTYDTVFEIVAEAYHLYP